MSTGKSRAKKKKKKVIAFLCPVFLSKNIYYFFHILRSVTGVTAAFCCKMFITKEKSCKISDTQHVPMFLTFSCVSKIYKESHLKENFKQDNGKK